MKHLLASALVVAGMAYAAPGSAQTAGVATSNPGSSLHGIGTAIANAANQAGLNATIQPATSPNQYLPLLSRGGIEFGVANLQEVNYAIEGKEWFEGSASPNIRVVGLVMPLVVAIFVREDSDIHAIADLRGLPMVDGYMAQNTILPQIEAMYATAGLSRADMQPVQVTSVTAGADAFIAGDTVGFYFALGAGKVREADAAVGGLRALPIEDTEENVALARQHWPVSYFQQVQPGPNEPGIKTANTFLAHPQGLFANADVSDDIVYEMTQIMYEGAQQMAATFAPFNLFDPENMVGEVAPAQYHPGAIRFYREVGLWQE